MRKKGEKQRRGKNDEKKSSAWTATSQSSRGKLSPETVTDVGKSSWGEEEGQRLYVRN